MNETKFTQCLQAYLDYCSRTGWARDESYKFYFANWLSRKVNLGLQTPEKILALCRESLKKDYSLKEDLSRIGVQFLQKSGRRKISIPISLSDIEIVQYLAKNDIPEESFFKQRGTSYPGLSGWLGTLLPGKFIPVVTSDFHESISYLFDLSNFPQSGYSFFIETQKYFKETKQYLKHQNLDELFLANIIAYLKVEYPNVKKDRYEEIDWNWITQDFHLFVYRKYLHDIPFKKSIKKSNDRIDEISKIPELIGETALETPQNTKLDIYEPAIFTEQVAEIAGENRNMEFDSDHYLSKHQKQIEKGAWAEEIVKDDEVNYLLKCGKKELAGSVRIVSGNPDYGYDVLSYEIDGTEKQIEVKSISTNEPKSFFISAHEFKKSDTLPNYYLYCISSINSEVQKIYRLKNPNLKDQNIFRITAVNYEVCFS